MTAPPPGKARAANRKGGAGARASKGGRAGKTGRPSAPTVLTARDLIKLATRVPPGTPVMLSAGGAIAFARADGKVTGHAELELKDGTQLCIVLEAVGVDA